MRTFLRRRMFVRRMFVPRNANTVWLTVAIAGCFSGDDFDLCTEDAHCGAGFVCSAGACVTGGGVGGDDGAGGGGDVTPEVTLEELGRTFAQENAIVTVPDLSLTARSATVRARQILVIGRIDGDGAGYSGGGGGGGGAAGKASEAVAGRGGASRDGRDGSEGRFTSVGGDGGRGGVGGGVGAAGGEGGLVGGLREGSAGTDAAYGTLALGDDACADADAPSGEPRPGNGGGGGGGGAGSECAGGGAGGAGAPGGGALRLEATERIVIRGSISLRGLAAAIERGAPSGEPWCATTGNDNCGACQGATPDGSGGDGASSSGDSGGGGLGGTPVVDAEPAGSAGGPGGGGSGGTLVLDAPEIVWEPGATVDVGGSLGLQNAGAVHIVTGTEVGLRPSDIVGYVCVQGAR
jgi:hypothetical protein